MIQKLFPEEEVCIPEERIHICFESYNCRAISSLEWAGAIFCREFNTTSTVIKEKREGRGRGEREWKEKPL